MTEIFAELQKGGIVMIPLLAASVLGLAVFIERLAALRRRKVIVPEIVSAIGRIEDADDLRVAERICEANPGAFAGVVLAALRNRGLPRDEQREVVLDQGRQEVRSLERGLVVLETIASVGPLLGLMGTVIGMVKVFNVISRVGIGQANILSGGISEALITTVTGLAVGIPALVAYNYFTSRAEGLVLDIEKHTTSLMHRMRAVAGGNGEMQDAV
ncbi:MAG: MotA/TolQ/ExbB proton channel family protein [Candidatus Krumholzibacteriota bacterium]|nr:MotA/TolQ/ExbB proton channel family protein [Candidatus Krumholzibacteriota bacterium]